MLWERWGEGGSEKFPVTVAPKMSKADAALLVWLPVSAGSPKDPGLMILSLQQVFQDRDRLFKDEDFSVTCTYLEVYNEVCGATGSGNTINNGIKDIESIKNMWFTIVGERATIYDLLVKNSGPLELREDPEQGVQVAGLKHVPVGTPDDILGLLDDGNRRRKTEATDANLQSSRSHAVLEILVKRKPANHYRVQQLRAKVIAVMGSLWALLIGLLLEQGVQFCSLCPMTLHRACAQHHRLKLGLNRRVMACSFGAKLGFTGM
eukprot:1159777-Pelagomonas_calceolata.AAC.6